MAVGLATPASAQACLSASDARGPLQNGQILPLSQIGPRVAASVGGQVVSAELCQSGGRYVYIVNVLSRAGQVRRLTVDAGTGAIIGGY